MSRARAPNAPRGDLMVSECENTGIGGTLDLRGVACPANSARALVRLESMNRGEVLEILVDGGQPIKNVVPALEREAHVVVMKEQSGSVWRLLVRAG